MRRQQQKQKREAKHQNKQASQLRKCPRVINDVLIPDHALGQYIARIDHMASRNDVRRVFLTAIRKGRRNDQDHALTKELAAHTRNIRWAHQDRQVVLFFYESTGFLACAARESGKVVLLTCFSTSNGSPCSDNGGDSQQTDDWIVNWDHS